jgi:hypothetical protein
MLSPDTLLIIGVHAVTAVAVLARTTERTNANKERIEKVEKTVATHEGEIGVLFGHARLTR